MALTLVPTSLPARPFWHLPPAGAPCRFRLAPKTCLSRWRLPERCPVCDSAALREEGGAVTRCPNRACPAKLKNRLLHLAGRAALDIDGLGEKLVDQLLDSGLVKELPDVFALSAEQLGALPRMGEKSAANLVAALERARATTRT